MRRLLIPLLCVAFMGIGAMAARSWEIEKLRAQLKAEKEADVQALRDGFSLAMAPVATMCSAAAFRSIRAANTANQAAKSANEIFTEQKNAIQQEIDK